MAYGALLSVAKVIEEILAQEHQDYSFLCGKDQMSSLHQNIISLQEFLGVPVPMKYTPMANTLESQLIDVAYQVEDIIEANTMGLPCAGNDRLSSSALYHCIDEVSSILQEAKKMKELFQQDKGTPAADSRTTNSSSVVESSSNNAKVGLEDFLKSIFKRVINHEKALQIIPVVGMGGIGKTTLARAVYEHPSTARHFDVCFWVTISQEYNIQDILLDLLPGENQPIGKIKQNVESLIVQVHKALFNRRFLIILDDMWDAKAWDGIMRAIPDNSNGSRVILTTRLSDVAAKVDSASPLHQMQLLHKETAWDLLRIKVYGQEPSLPALEGVGRRIAENCKGLPLLIVVIAGLLKSNRTIDYWEDVARNVSETASSADELDGILTLSYNNLPPHLKACFLYMGAFPEDAHISVSRLIQLWIAEGFVKPQAPKTLEEIAEEYLEDLVERNLVLVTGKRCNGKIRTCSIHDVPRALGLKRAKEDKFLQRFAGYSIDDVTFQNITTSQRHVSVSTKIYDSPSNDTCNLFVRSLLFIDCTANLQLILLASSFRLLKVLYGVRVTTESMLRQIFELTNLRLLQFSIDNNFGSTLMVPSSISKLQKLETLIVTEGSRSTFPVDIWKIPKLRHIILSKDCTLLFPLFSQGYPVLEHLRTLSWLKNVKFNKNLIERMPDLKRFRYIYGDYFRHLKLNDLCQLENLYLAVDFGSLPANLCFPANLKKLTLLQTHISWEHMSSMVGSLPNLEVLQLKGWSVEGDTWEPNEGEFLRLKYLKMEYLELRHWLAECMHFPCLETLVMRGIHSLEEIPPSIGDIDTLEKLIVKNCTSQVDESAKRIREEQESSGNSALQVIVIF